MTPCTQTVIIIFTATPEMGTVTTGGGFTGVPVWGATTAGEGTVIVPAGWTGMVYTLVGT